MTVGGHVDPGQRRPRVARRQRRVAAEPDQQPDEPERDHGGVELPLVIPCRAGQEMDGGERRLGHRRVDGGDTGTVDARAPRRLIAELTARCSVGEQPGIAQTPQVLVGWRVAVGVDAGRLHPAVPRVAVQVVGQLGGVPRQRRRRQRHRPGKYQQDHHAAGLDATQQQHRHAGEHPPAQNDPDQCVPPAGVAAEPDQPGLRGDDGREGCRHRNSEPAHAWCRAHHRCQDAEHGEEPAFEHPGWGCQETPVRGP